MMNYPSLLLFTFALLWCSCGNESSDSTLENTPQNGDLNSSFSKAEQTPTLSAEQKLAQDKDILLAEGWEEREVPNGQLPSCYNLKPKKGKVDNYLEVVVGSGTDVSIKVMEVGTDQCVRYVFINSGTSYSIENIPVGRYYLKIAYGKNWLSKVNNGQCVGKFIRNPIYEKGKDIMDFSLQYSGTGYSIPSFKLQLDVIASSAANSFESQHISESEFNQ